MTEMLTKKIENTSFFLSPKYWSMNSVLWDPMLKYIWTMKEITYTYVQVLEAGDISHWEN